MKQMLRNFRDNLYLWFVKLLSVHKGWLCGFFLVFLIGFITGIMTCVNYLDVVTYKNIINKYLISFLTLDSSYLSFFFMMLAWFLMIAVIIWLFTKNFFCVVLNFILLAIMSYVWGFDICIVITTLGLAGILYGVVLLGCIGLLIFINIIIIQSVACKRFCETKNICSQEQKQQYFKIFFVLLFCGALCVFVLSFLFCSIHIFVIVD